MARAVDPLAEFDPLVRRWFRDSYGAPSPPQAGGWPAIARGSHTLILAPTGTGKTLAAFLRELDRLVTEAAEEPLANAVHVVYVSPLKALNNDIQRNLEQPLEALRALFEAEGRAFPEIRIAVRTGDTPAAARAKMIRKTPHILITTPESLNIMLTSERARTIFSGTRTVIIDEIHAIAGNKRGAHLALTLERLERQAGSSPQRIGLSATQKPLDEVARFLGGCEHGGPKPVWRHVEVVDCGMAKDMVLSVESPVADLSKVGGTVWPAVAQLVLNKIRESRTTLVFVNNRAQAERIAARVNTLAEEELALPYHGSLARERRLVLEERLKAGEIRALITTSSLELGIDIGSVDLVIQLQSPKRVAAGLQRVGRAGHTLGVASHGVFVPTFRDDAVEIAAVVGAMRDGDVEPTQVVQNALDVLAQAIVAAVSIDTWKPADLFDLVRRAYPYHALTRGAFDEVVAMLSGKYPSELAAELEARITWDRVNDTLYGSRGARMTAVISGGTIPDRGLYTVNLPDRTRLGELDEEFVHESRVGDVFQLGSSTWRISAIEHDRVIVTPAPGRAARMPFWHGEYGARSLALSRRVGALRRALASGDPIDKLAEGCGCDEATITSLTRYISAQRGATATVPDDRDIVIEHFRDELGAVRVIVHAPFGGRVTAPWGMALAHRARESLRDADVQVQTTDDGIMLRLPDLGGAAQLHALLDLTAAEAERLVLEEVGGTSLFGARFRMNAARALLLPRGNPRKRMPLWLQRLKSLDLLQVVRQFPAFPILVETYREVLQDAFDMAGLAQVLGAIRTGEIRTHYVETTSPSPFAASLQFGFVMDWMYGDDTPRAEQRAALLSLDRALLQEVMGQEPADDDTLAAMREIVEQRRGAAPGARARSADELAVLIDRAGDLTEEELEQRVAEPGPERRGDPVRELWERGRIVGISVPGASHSPRRIILTETFARYAAAFGERVGRSVEHGTERIAAPASEAVPAALRAGVITRGAARREVLARFLALAGPVTAREVAARYGWPVPWAATRLGELERAGKLVRGRYRASVTDDEWATRRVVEGARRRALARVRKQVEAVQLPQFAAFLAEWQHADPAFRLEGSAGVAAALRQLYGIARPGVAWERDYLRARVRNYQPQWLADVKLEGDVVWAGEGKLDEASGILPLSRVRFFERGTGRVWLGEDAPPVLSAAATSVADALAREGASLVSELAAITGLGMFALREALRELTAAGMVTNDTVEALREIVRWKPLVEAEAPDPARWLPADFVPTTKRYPKSRGQIRRLPKWRRPDLPGRGTAGWVGRWSLLRRAANLGPELTEEERAESIARKWLERYGVVTREWWVRERPPVPWRQIYWQLKRLEMRGEVRRGYFVQGLAGAQFATSEAVERLRALAARKDDDHRFVVLASSDPANPYSLRLETVERDPLSRPRGAGGLIVLRNGRVAMMVEGRGKRVTAAEWLSPDEASEARRAVEEHLG